MRAEPGTYIVVFGSRNASSVQIGRWGRLEVASGFYLYVGSAFGPGGVRARVLRHCRRKSSRHWHIDYLMPFVDPQYAWYNHAPVHLEHDWAQAIRGQSEITAIKGFGCSDCTCYSHLFATTSKPDMASFARLLDCELRQWSPH